MPPQGFEGVLVIQRLLSGVLWVLASLYFVGVLLLALGLSYLLPFKTIDPLLKALMRGLLRILFIRVEVDGAEGIDPNGTFIFVANHSSMLDIPLVAGFVPGYLRGIEASNQHGWPLYGWVMGRLGNLPIQRDDVHASISTMRRAEAYLERGEGSLMVFPEGHRTTTGKLLPFKKLPFYLAKRSGRAIVPVVIKGMFEINNKNSFLIRPGRVSLSFGETLESARCRELSVVELRDEVERRMRHGLSGAAAAPYGARMVAAAPHAALFRNARRRMRAVSSVCMSVLSRWSCMEPPRTMERTAPPQGWTSTCIVASAAACGKAPANGLQPYVRLHGSFRPV